MLAISMVRIYCSVDLLIYLSYIGNLVTAYVCTCIINIYYSRYICLVIMLGLNCNVIDHSTISYNMSLLR